MTPFLDSFPIASCSPAEYRAAIDVKHLAGNVTRPIGAKEHNRVGYVIRRRKKRGKGIVCSTSC